MRKTLMFGTLIALFAVSTLAQASDVTAIQRNANEASQKSAPAVRDEGRHARRHHSGSQEEHHAERRGRPHHDDSRQDDEHHHSD